MAYSVFQVSGWSRLWVFLSGIYLCLVLAWGFSGYPKGGGHLLGHVSDYVDSKDNKLLNAGDLKEVSDQALAIVYILESLNERDHVNNDAFSSLSGAEFSEDFEEVFSIELAKIEESYKIQLFEERKKYIFIVLLVWGIPVIAVFFLGLSVRWVLSGFRILNPDVSDVESY